ncbi:MAG: peptidase S41 [Chitinophagaceae bacterium]|nr:MAG: peptidase S41 [Chitinophagaceae bacterium]
MKKLLFSLGILVSTSLLAQENPLWLRYPAISPDGQSIVFGYKGDLYKVPAAGGEAVALTVHEAHDYMPVWSRDGKSIAFASDRYGNFDVFVMPSTGGEAKRLTFNSAQDVPYDFSPDGKMVLFSTARVDLYSSARFPNRTIFMKLYTVPVNGGRSVMVSSAGAEFARFNTKGDKIIFQDRKGYEDAFRKHHVSSVTRDIWVQDLGKGEYKKLSGFEGEDREPLWSSDDKNIYYLSEKDGSQNIYRATSDGSGLTALTSLKDHPVRNLSRSNDETLCFTWNGEIWTLRPGGQPQKVGVSIHTDTRGRDEKILPVTTGVSETVLSPNGKEVALVVRGEIFVTSVDGGITRRITNTAQQERSVSFSPDGRTLYYAAERNNSWDIYKSSIIRSEEPYFYISTNLAEEAVLSSDADEFQPLVSPDGKQLAYLEERTILKVLDLATKKSKTIIPSGLNYSYADGDQNFTWSPDSKWLAFGLADKHWPLQDIALARADGTGERVNITRSGFVENRARWGFGGKGLMWLTERDGKKPLARQGEREMDVYISFFDQAAFDRFRLTKEELALEKEMTPKGREEQKKDSIRKAGMAKWDPEFEGIESRRLRLTINSGNIADYALSEDGEKLFFLAKMEKGYDLWQTNPRTKETRLLAKIDGGPGRMDLTADGKTLIVASDNRLLKVEAESGKLTPVPASAELVLKASEERAYIFEHAWRQVGKKFYQPTRLGAPWKMYHDTYARFLPYINNNYDFQELLSELLGELNASHTGGRYSVVSTVSDVTPSLGLLYDETFAGPGVKIMEVLNEGPFYKATTKIRTGTIIEKINNESVDNGDWSALLNRQAGKYVAVSLFDPKSGQRWEETAKPITQAEEQALLYKRWVAINRRKVEELSGGKIGYVHVQGMNDASYRVVFEEALGRNIDKAALVVDTRFNGGGNLHDELSDFLNGKAYYQMAPHGEKINTVIPAYKWTRPSIVIMGESNYSDAHLFPYAYKSKNVGKLLGMPVPGTGTSVWWETQIDPSLVFGIPMIGYIGKENRPLENLQLDPDIRVENDFRSILMGKDPQLEKAVEEMLKTVK